MTVNYATILRLINVKRRLDYKIIKTLHALQNNGGDVEGYLEKLIMNGGKEDDILHKDKSSVSADKAMTELIMIFNNMMKEKIDYEYEYISDCPLIKFQETYSDFLKYVGYKSMVGKS